MWVTTDYKGNPIRWYEAELIEQIRKECKNCYQNNVKYYGLSLKILDLIKEKE